MTDATKEWELALDEVVEPHSSPKRRGRGRQTKPLRLDYERDMTEEDLRELSQPIAVRPPAAQELRYSHQRLARLVALGERNAAQMSGYDAQRLWQLKNDPAFQDLVAYYKAQVDAAAGEVTSLLEAWGMDYLEEIHRRFVDCPDEFEPTELFKMGTDLLGRTAAPTKNAGQGALPGRPEGGVNFQINFVKPQEVIDVTPTKSDGDAKKG